MNDEPDLLEIFSALAGVILAVSISVLFFFG